MKGRAWATAPLLLCGMLSFFLIFGPHDAAPAGVQYSIQVAATQDWATAEKQVAELAKLGHNAFYRQETIQGKGQWYRVYVERFNSKAEAEKEARTLKSLGLVSDYAVRPLGETQEPSEPGKAAARPEGGGDRRSGPSTAGREAGKAGQVRKDGASLRESPPAERKGREPGPGIHCLHVGSYKEKENAEKSVQELVRHGQKAFLVEEGPVGGKWFRVYVGEFGTEQEATRAGAMLKEKRWITYFKPVSFAGGIPSGQSR